MKANDEIVLKVFSNIYHQSNSIKESIITLFNFKLLTKKQCDEILQNLKSDPELATILHYLSKNKQLINYIIFFNNYYLLTESIEKALTIINEKNKIIKEIVSSLIYPAILILLTSLALFFISVYIIPQLNILNANKNSDYQILMFFLKYLPLSLLISLSIIIILVLIVYFCLRKNLVKTVEIMLKTPVFNQILKYYTSLTFSLYLKETIKDVPFSLDSVNSLEQQCRNRLIQYLCSLIKIALKNGEDVFNVIRKINLLNDGFIQTMLIARDSKQMSFLLNDYFRTNVFILQKRIKLFLAIFIPLIVSAVGIILIMLYLTIMLPILDMDVAL